MDDLAQQIKKVEGMLQILNVGNQILKGRIIQYEKDIAMYKMVQKETC